MIESKFNLKKLNLGKINKVVLFGDIHWGARNNSDQHNMDNLDYIDWLIEKIKMEQPSHIAFLGDWFENRNAINVKTLDYASEGIKRLNQLNIPIIFIIGNHDLYHRGNREVYSTHVYHEFKNVHLISEPTKLDNDWLVVPFLFKDEYSLIAGEINKYKYVLGHFEFRGFVVTGNTKTLDHGPDANLFSKSKYIFSGHFHKRQWNKNIIYIGNVFPTNFGDADDKERGCCVFNEVLDDVKFYDWDKAPLFYKTSLSRVLNGDADFAEKSRVRCLLDLDVSYSEVQTLKEEMIDGFKLREFSVEEDCKMKQSSLEDGLETDDEVDMTSLDNTIRTLISNGVKETTSIKPTLLIEIYNDIKSK